MRTASRLGWWWLIPALLLMVGLGARMLNSDSLWSDEYFSLYDSGGATFGPLSPLGIWQRIAERNPHHVPGFFVLLNGWGQLVGWTAFSARALSLMFGVLAVAWVYRLGRDMVTPKVGLYAALIVASSAFFGYYLHEIRMYTLIVLLAAFVVWVYFRICTAPQPPKWYLWLGLILGVAAMLYTHYFALLPLGAVGLYHLLIAPKNRRWWWIAAAVVGAGVLFLPWVGYLLGVVREAAATTTEQPSGDNIPDTLRLSWLGLRAFGNGFILPLLLGLLAGLLALRDPDLRRRGAWRAWFFAVGVMLSWFVSNAILDVGHEGRLRYMMSAWPFLAMVVALGILALANLTRLRPLAPILLVVWMGVGVWSSLTGTAIAGQDGTYQVYPMNRVAEGLHEFAQPGDTVVNVLPPGMISSQYSGVADFYFQPLGIDFRTMEEKAQQRRRDRLQQDTIASLEDKQRVWVAYMPGYPSRTLAPLETALAQDFHACTRLPYGDSIELALYSRTTVCCVANTPTDARIRFGDTIAITDFTPPEIHESALSVTIGWAMTEAMPPNTYSAALHVIDSAETLAAQADYGLPYQRFDCHTTDIDVSQLAPGSYTLMVMVYAWESGARLTGSDSTSGQQGERLALGDFTVPSTD